MFDEVLRECLASLGMNITDEQIGRMRRFSELLLEKNKVMNLTAIKTPEEVARRHMADSLFLLRCTELKGKKILDIGTGAGFPGMPLKLYDLPLDITMLDSTAKRIAFINEAAEDIGIAVKTLAIRAEEASAKMSGSFDIVTSRAVAPLNILCELSLGFLKHGGLFMPMKSCGQSAEDEISESEHAISFMGGCLRERREYSVEQGVMRQVLIIEKTAPTPKGYPRKYAAISKKPL
ncbi:MAG: 16S rRNA (guanine(527)-N(7))-methyltransferase RsmG [Clostridiaceae bacterium]|nr:16S rRNA (guanine(527)-N(7))-methyltransferase RsmG [Clostridiaceae bacterium]